VSGEIPRDSYEPVAALLTRFFAGKTKAEMVRAAIDRKLLLAPALSLDEIIDSEQLAAREFSVTHANTHFDVEARYPGAMARFSKTPITQRRPPPTLGEHSAELAREAPREPCSWNRCRDSVAPLEGVKILDLFWVLAGPGATRMLADYGATVVHVESQERLDTLRVIPPYQFNHPHPEGAGGFQSANANKLGMTLDIDSPGGLDVLEDLGFGRDNRYVLETILGLSEARIDALIRAGALG
jgi:crotonobetainyl-CoA:carnitine CoA-transferase CaiB-like acyl-CoA transferase